MNNESVSVAQVIQPQKRHWFLIFSAGVVVGLLVTLAIAGVYLFYLDSKIKNLVQFQEHYFEQQFSSFSNRLFYQLHDDLIKKFNEDFARIELELQKKLSDRGQTFSKLTVEQLAQTEKEIQTTLSKVSENLATNIPAAIRTKLLEDRQAERTASLEGVGLAENLLKEGNSERAMLLFINALNKDPGNISILSRYSTSVFDWSRQKIGQGELSFSLDVINETDRFLKNQAVSVAPQDLQKLEELILGCEQIKKEIENKIASAQQVKDSEKENELLAKINENLAIVLPTEEITLTQTIEKLQAVQEAIETISMGNSVVTDELKNSHIAKVKIAETDLNVLSVIQLLEKNDASKDKNTESATKENIFTLNAIAQQFTILKPDSSPEMKKKIDSALTMISKKIEDIDRQSQTIALSKIQKEAEGNKRYMTVNTSITANQALKALVVFQKFVSTNSVEIRDKTYLDTVNALNTNIEQVFVAWQKEQGLKYDRWILKELGDFYNKYKEELNKWGGPDTHKLYNALLTELGDIDPRFLSPMANRAYSEVFELFFEKLNQAQKIKLPSEMAVAIKLTPQQF